MSFDGFFLHHMVQELKAELLSGRIQKINQPFEQELVLQIRGNRKNQKLLLSAHSEMCIRDRAVGHRLHAKS